MAAQPSATTFLTAPNQGLVYLGHPPRFDRRSAEHVLWLVDRFINRNVLCAELCRFFVILMLAACSRSTAADAKPQATAGSHAGAAASAPPPAAAAPPPPAAKPVPPQLPDIVARVNGEAINKADFENAVKGLEGRAGGPVPADQRDRVYRGVLDDMIGYKLLVQEAKTRKIAVPDADIDAQIAQIRSQFQTDAQFQQALAAQKMTVEGGPRRCTLRHERRKARRRRDRREGRREARSGHRLLPEEPGQVSAGTPRAREPHPDRSPAERRRRDQAAGQDQGRRRSEGHQGGQGFRGGREGELAGPRQRAQRRRPRILRAGTDGAAVRPGRLRAQARRDERASSRRSSAITSSRSPRSRSTRVVPLEEAKPQIEQYLDQQNRQEQTEAFVNALKAKAKIEILM